MKTNLQDLIRATPQFATLPATTLRLLDLLEDAAASAQDICAVIELDPGLSANLLKLCNSSYYGMRRRIGTVQEALVLLGNRTVVTLAFAASMGDLMRGPLAAYRISAEEMWHHSLATALGSSYLIGRGRKVGDPDLRGRAFLAGLMHDVGKMLLDGSLREQLDQLPVGSTASEMIEAEEKILGCSHCTAGAALAEAWGFPEQLVDAIRRHHDGPDAGADQGLAGFVRIADRVACQVGIECGSSAPPEIDAAALSAGTGVSVEHIAFLLEHLHDDLQRLVNVVECSPCQ